MSIPTRVFIVPYRDRVEQKKEFTKNMRVLLEDIKEPYEIYFAHQADQRPFNRGAMKNLGFFAIKNKYPNHYKNITFIFHDVDTYPMRKGLIDYTTRMGIVKHYYGFTYALGGIFAIKGEDFEKTKGFPNFWGWGLEDNTMNTRCIANKLYIDRSIFYDIRDRRILRPFDGYKRTISKRDAVVYKYEKPDDITSIKNINYMIENEFINIFTFDCMMDPAEQVFITYDIRNGNKLIIDERYRHRVWSMEKMFT